jgi:aerobic-type carbon monoxide dehydrogenase small subunit (CoxS/CutS family)
MNPLTPQITPQITPEIKSQSISIRINGQMVQRTVSDDLALVDFLQEELGLTGTKLCCGIGVCKACTVAAKLTPQSLSQPLLACSTPAVLLDGQSITTIEGVGKPDQLSAVQQSFLDHFAFQCGYCTPGFVMATNMLIERLRISPVPLPISQLDAAINNAVGQHICRCTGYERYHRAIRAVILAETGLVTGVNSPKNKQVAK